MIIKKLIAMLVLAIVSSGAQAETLQFATNNGAINGYDPVAYFSVGEAQPGSQEITARWNGAEWRFTTEENRDLFLAAPEKYAPQYGGFCALGMAHGGSVPTDPTAFTVWDGRLYLNMTPEVTETWRYNPDKLIVRADEKWEDKNPAP